MLILCKSMKEGGERKIGQRNIFFRVSLNDERTRHIYIQKKKKRKRNLFTVHINITITAANMFLRAACLF